MRIALATNFLYPEKMGGTELYCYQLAESLIKQGHEVFWIVPHFNNDTTITSQTDNGINIIRFAAIATGSHPDESFVSGSFIYQLKKHFIDVVHFHEFGGYEGVSAPLINAVKDAGMAVVVTLHLVHYICQSGTMRYGGTVPCDGKFIPNRCGSCNKFSHSSSNISKNYFLTRVFNNGFDLIEKLKFRLLPGVNSVLAGFKKPFNFIDSLKAADKIVCITKWFRDVLIINGVPADKIAYIPQAVPVTAMNNQISVINRRGYVFIGRINKEKGIGLLVSAAKKLKNQAPGIFIDVYGPVSESDTSANTFLEEINQHNNINYKGVLDPDNVSSCIVQYKAVLLPSIVAEMAPLIIMESNRSQVPVIASDVPGSSELLNDYHSGLLFNYNSVEDLIEKMLMVESGVTKFTFRQPVKSNYDDLAARYSAIYSAHSVLVSNS